MGRLAAVLSGRNALFGALVLALAAYYAVVERLPDQSLWRDVALAALVLIPGVFALVLLALPLRHRRGVTAVGLSFAVLALACESAGLDALANFSKLAAVTAIGFWFLELFERLSWVVLVAAVVPLVDSISVWRGPTRHIVTEQPEVFSVLSFGFPVPDEGSFQLGLPDLLFFSLFLAAAARWALRVGWTWLSMTASFGITLTIALWLDPFDLGGLPALPLLSAGFLAPNADLLLRELRREGPDASVEEEEPLEQPSPPPAAAPKPDHRVEPLKRQILDEAVREDWWRLWEPLEAARSLHPDLGESERKALAELALRELYDDGLVCFYDDPSGTADVEHLRTLSREAVDAALAGDGWRRSPPAEDVRGIWIGATEQGERYSSGETPARPKAAPLR